MNYQISVKASEDIENIWLYTATTWSVEQADKYYNLIFDNIEHIARYPLLGKEYKHVLPNYRCLQVESHLIFYKYKENQDFIEIIRILHQSMDVERWLE